MIHYLNYNLCSRLCTLRSCPRLSTSRWRECRLQQCWRSILQSILSISGCPSPTSCSLCHLDLSLRPRRRLRPWGCSPCSRLCTLRSCPRLSTSRWQECRLQQCWRSILQSILSIFGCPSPTSCSPNHLDLSLLLTRRRRLWGRSPCNMLCINLCHLLFYTVY